MMGVWQFLFGLSIVWQLGAVFGLRAPRNPCPSTFEYKYYNGEIFGKLTIGNLSVGTTQISVKFSQLQPLESQNYKLFLYDSLETSANNIRNGLPVLYRINFANTNTYPRLTEIAVNNVVVCSSPPYESPSYSYALRHTLRVGAMKKQSSQSTSRIDVPPPRLRDIDEDDTEPVPGSPSDWPSTTDAVVEEYQPPPVYEAVDEDDEGSIEKSTNENPSTTVSNIQSHALNNGEHLSETSKLKAPSGAPSTTISPRQTGESIKTQPSKVGESESDAYAYSEDNQYLRSLEEKNRSRINTKTTTVSGSLQSRFGGTVEGSANDKPSTTVATLQPHALAYGEDVSENSKLGAPPTLTPREILKPQTSAYESVPREIDDKIKSQPPKPPESEYSAYAYSEDNLYLQSLEQQARLRNKTTTTTTTTTSTTTTTTPAPIIQTRIRVPPPNFNIICGYSSVSFEIRPFIHHGSNLIRGQMPWLTAISQKTIDGSRFLCGGSLIAARTVLTAAHCVSGLTADRLILYIGRHDLYNYDENGVAVRNVKRQFINPEYNAASFPDADLAVLQFDPPIRFSPYITPICLWNNDDSNSIEGESAYVAGWGGDEFGQPITQYPKIVDAKIVNFLECFQTDTKFISNRTICAGNRDGSGPCMGDSGGGLMFYRDGRWMLRGVVSAGKTIQRQCNLKEFVLYCDVSKHLDWVKSNLLY